jgi:hypothetical protein
MTDRGFTHPNFGNQVDVEVKGCEVRLIFTASNSAKANSLAEMIVGQLKSGAINLTLMGRPTSVQQDKTP